MALLERSNKKARSRPVSFRLATVDDAMASPEYVRRLQTFIKQMHGVDSKRITSAYVWHAFRRETVWEGVVEVFELSGHPRANLCYAWTDAEDAIITVLAIPPVTKASDAVEAYLEARRGTL